MRSPFVKRQTSPRSELVLFPLFGLATSLSGSVACLDFRLLAQITHVCTTHILRFNRQRDGDSRELAWVSPCDLETFLCPRAVLLKDVAEGIPFAS